MAQIKWRDSYSTGVEYFDNEHKQLVSLLNQMFEINRDHIGEDSIRKIIDEVLQYTIYHFGHEEKVMQAVHYAYVEEHIQQHYDLKNKVQEFKDGLDQGEKKTVNLFYLFLRDWLIQHILDIDKQYSTALKNKNIEELLAG